MNHPAELTLHKLLTDLRDGKTSMSHSSIEQIVSGVRDSLERQFGGGGQQAFRLRMSNIGRPYCQLWYQKNRPDIERSLPTTFILNMMLGDIVEAVFKGLLTEAGVEYTDSEEVRLELEDGTIIKGTTDLSIDGAVDDVKSASPWSYMHKFSDFQSLKKGDSFGYVGQLAGYAKGLDKKAGGWWVVNKANGNFKYVEANELDIDEEITTLQDKVQKLDDNEFERSFEAVPEYYRRKPTGNTVLNSACKFCDYKRDCYKSLITRPSIPSTAKEPPEVDYVHIEEKYND
tara:strand:+ start:3924 stop:4784 length:861 start_codon:yes stop_codon:yes gene_type:complete